MSPPCKSCCSYLSQRWITVLLAFSGSFNVHAMRTCISIIITEMVVPLNETAEAIGSSCPGDNKVTQNANETIATGEKFDWDERMQGLILSSSYWGYFLTMILGGLIADKIGGKIILCSGLLSTSVLTMLTPMGVQWGGAYALIAIRAMIGLGEGPMFPALSALVAKWIPENERSWAVSCAFSGGDVGNIFGMAVSGAIIRYSGSWKLVFYSFGTIGLICFFLSYAFCYSQPSECPVMSESEAEYLKKNLKNTNADMPAAPWRYILLSKPVWALLILNTAQAFGYFALISDMPKYMSNVLKFSVDDNGYVSSIAPFCSFVSSAITGWCADRIIERKLMSIVLVRKIAGTLTVFVPGIFLVLTSYAGCNAVLAVVLYSSSWLFTGFFNCSISSNSLDLAPNFAGTLLGFIFGMSTTTGLIAPYLVGVMVPNQTIEEWRTVFWMVFWIFTSCNIVYLIFGSADVQEWNDPDFLKKKEKKSESNGKEAVELLPVVKV